MPQYGLIGYPLGHSFSKKYFTEKFEKEGLTDLSYENFPIPSIEEFPAILKNNPELRGLNVTIPYKEAVLRFLDEQDEIVRQAGACNCIRIEDGKLSGFNTDVPGFEKSLEVFLQPHHTHALILGTGGASKAVKFVLNRKGIESKFVSRKANPEKGILGYEMLDAAILEKYTLIVNTTPVGTFPDVTAAPDIPYSLITAMHYCYDLVYNPAETTFLRLSKARGALVKNGSDMLQIQAEEGWTIWNKK